jgi:hypothetical protein
MIALGRRLAELGFTLHSGGARKKDGTGISADTAFEQGCDEAQGPKRIFLPYKGFHKSTSLLYTQCEDAEEMAHYYYHQPRITSQYILRLMARNCYQILGADLESPVDIVICWTKGGKVTGGTGQALRIANDPQRDIKVINLFNTNALDQLSRHLRLLGVKGLRDETTKPIL